MYHLCLFFFEQFSILISIEYKPSCILFKCSLLLAAVEKL